MKMPQQIFQVLRCYKCKVFQVHQCKKAIKWECKMCGEKQSIKRHYGIGTAKDCRGHVQRLNGISAEIDEKKNAENTDEEQEVSYPRNIANSTTKIIESKWKNYMEEINETTSFVPVPKNTMYLNDTEVVLEIPKKRRQNKYSKNPYNYKKNKFNSQSYKSNNSSDMSDLETEVSSDCVKPIEKDKAKFIPPTSKSYSNWDFSEVGSIETEKVIDRKSKSCHNTTFKRERNEEIIKDTQLHNYKKQNMIATPLIQCNSKWANYVDNDEIDEQEDCDEEENNQLCINSGGDRQNVENKQLLINAHDDDVFNGHNTRDDKTINITTDESHKPYNIDSNDLRNFTGTNSSTSKEGSSNKENLQNIFSLCDDKDLDDVFGF